MSDKLFTELKCQRCGGELKQNGEDYFVCPYCGKSYINNSVQKMEAALHDVLEAERQRSVANLRRLLWNEVKKEFVSNREVERLSKAILNYIPEDFYANFYLATCIEGNNALGTFLDTVDVNARADDIPEMLDYLLKALKPEWAMAVGCFIERAYKDSDISLYNKYRNMYEKIYAAIEEGVFEPSLPRDVFVAYSSRDMAKVTALVAELEKENLTCFVAARNLRHGSGSVENYRKAINTAIEHCSVVVFVSSRTSRSIRCDAYSELSYIQELDKRTGVTKPRVEFLVENYIGTAMERFFTQFFKNLEYCVSERAVTERVLEKLVEQSKHSYKSASNAETSYESAYSTSQDNTSAQSLGETAKKLAADVYGEVKHKAQEGLNKARNKYSEWQEENRRQAEEQRQRKLKEQQEKRIKQEQKRQKKQQKQQKEEGKKSLTSEQRTKRIMMAVCLTGVAIVFLAIMSSILNS